MKKRFILILALGFPWLTNAQQSFSLAKARTYALTNNYQAKNAQYDVDKALHKIKETIAIGLPQVTAKASYSNFIKQPVQVVPAEFFGGKPGEFAEVIFGTQQNATGEIMATQLLFDGSYIVGLQATKTYAELSKGQQRLTNMQVVEAVTDAYHMVLVAEENLRILKSSEAQMKQLLRDTKVMFENGMVEESDVDQIEINFKNLQNSYSNATMQMDIARKMLNFQLGLALETEVSLTDNIDDLAISNADQNYFETTYDVKQNASFQIAATNLTAQHLFLKNEKAKFLPQLSMFASHQQNAFANEFNFLNNDGKWFPTTLVGVNLNIPIFSSGYRNQKVKQAQLEFKKAQESVKLASQSAELAMLNAKATYNNALGVYQNQKQSLQLAERIKDKTTIKYQEGLASSFELTQAENQFLNTQGQYIQATFSLLSAKNKLDKALNNY